VTRYEKRVAKLRKEYLAKVKARDAEEKKAKGTAKDDNKAVKK